MDVDRVHDGPCDDVSGCIDDICSNNACQYPNNYTDDRTTDTCVAGFCERGFESSGTPCEDDQFCTEPGTCDGVGTYVGSTNDRRPPTEIRLFLDTSIPEQGGGGA